MTEWIMIAMIGLSAVLFPAGGTHIEKVGGQKWLRRELLPVLLGILFFVLGVAWWKCLVFAVAQDCVFRLPYGERTPYWLKALVFCSFAMPSMIIGITGWQAVAPAVVLVLFLLSNNKRTAQAVPHKVWEASAGFVVGVICAVIASSL